MPLFQRSSSPATVHVLLVRVAALSCATRARLMPLLPPHEQAHLARLRRPADQDRYLAAHAVLRQWLVRALGQPDLPPATLPLAALPGGKPVLAGWAAGRLHFSLSHAGDWIALALADRPVGVDVEALTTPDAALLAFCATPAEREAVTQSADPRTAFTRLWTAKEAVLKAHGAGLSLGLDGWSVSPHATEGWHAIQIDTHTDGVHALAACQVHRIAVDDHHTAAVVLAPGTDPFVTIPTAPRVDSLDLDTLPDRFPTWSVFP